jgi:predicted nucleotidyltransferase
MKQIDNEMFNEIVNRIVSTTDPEKIILFGSYAWGIPSNDSDIDIIVIKNNIQSRIEEYRKIRKSLMGLLKSFDIIIVSPNEFDMYAKTWANSVFAEASKKGVILYAI